MLSKAKIKFVKALATKKQRREAGVFLAEGPKIVGELLRSSFEVVEVFAVAEWLNDVDLPSSVERWEVSRYELERISELTTPNLVLALVKIPDMPFEPLAMKDKLILGLDDIQDPGNLGSIVRMCDWFGIDDIIASRTTADCFNPKVVQATMGSIARVRVHYRDDLAATVRQFQDLGKTAYATSLGGDSIYRSHLDRDALILFGNESQGLSRELEHLCSRRIGIPNFRRAASKAESLNVAMAASIVCSEFRRRTEAI